VKDRAVNASTHEPIPLSAPRSRIELASGARLTRVSTEGWEKKWRSRSQVCLFHIFTHSASNTVLTNTTQLLTYC
jgi:hypothetical protein